MALETCFDEPFADSSAVPTHCVSALARRHVTVALSGDGGDETFTGYGFRYVPHAIEERLRKYMPRQIGPRAFGHAGRLWPTWRSLPRPLRLSTVWQNLALDEAGAYYRDLCFLKPADTRRLLGRPPDEDPRLSAVYASVTDPYRRCPSTSAVQRAQYADLKIYLPNDVLTKVDRTSMAHGLEVRSPFLDHRVVEFAFRLPTSRKMPRLQPKHLLRTLARERLPASVVGLPKRGFTAPAGEWIAGAGAGMFEDEVLGAEAWVSGVVDTQHARRMFDQHRDRRADHTHALWALWMLERWGRRQLGYGAGCERKAS
jgi:asparagine synthase (glutamine-hydrolysing)